MEGRSEARGYSVAGNWIRVTLPRWGRARHQFGIHEVVHILAVLAVLPREAFLDGPCGREVRDTAIPRKRKEKKKIIDRKRRERTISRAR